MLLILSCKTMYCYRKVLPSTSSTSGNASELNSTIRSGLIPGGRSLKRGRQAVFFTAVNPMKGVFGMEETPRHLTKPRVAPYKNTWKRHQNTVKLVQFEARSRERLAFFTKHDHMQSFSHITLFAACIESGKYENTGGALPKGSLDPKIATGCSQIELAMWSTRSTKPRRKIFLGPTKRFEKLRGNTNNAVDFRIPDIPLSAVEQQDTTRENVIKKNSSRGAKH